METQDLSRVQWRKSSHSGTDSNCVEVAVAWRTSSHSSTDGACVEVAPCSGARVLVRDTKDRGGPVLSFRPSAWSQFTGQVKSAAS